MSSQESVEAKISSQAKIHQGILQEKRQRERALRQQCQAVLEGTESTALTHSRTLQDLGQWWCLPGPETRLLKRSDAEEAAKVAPDVVNLKELEEKWMERHRALRKPPAVKKRGLRLSECHRQGLCHCKRGREGRIVGMMWEACRAAMKRILPGNTASLLHGDVVLVWYGASDPNILFVTHVSLQYMRPYRPTFLMMEPDTDKDRIDMLELGRRARLQSPLMSEEYITIRAQQTKDGGPLFQTQLEFASRLQPVIEWRVGVLMLSSRAAPILAGLGRARVVAKRFQTVLVREAREDDNLDDDGDSPDAWLEGFVPDLSGGDDTATENDGNMGDAEAEDVEAAKDLSLEVKSDDDVWFDKDLLRVWEEAEMQEKVSSSSSSQSSSSGSSFDSTAGSKAGSTSVKSQKSKDSKSSRASRKQKAPPEEPAAPVKRGRRQRENVIPWCGHHLTIRMRDNLVGGYQMSCQIVGHRNCAKELSASLTNNSLQGCREVLKSWILLGHGLAGREEHMTRQLRDELLASWKQGLLLPEKDLDEIASAGEEKPIEAPCVELPASAPPASAGSILGEASPGISQQFHENMIAQAERGELPVTTRAQRERNRPSGGTRYIMPESLKAVVNAGYLHPNLPPPRGMQWTYLHGTWRLGLRGG